MKLVPLDPSEWYETDADETWREDPDECPHDWERTGFNLTWGDIYECKLCGDRTP